MSITNYRCAVLGKPIAHSLSPLLHNAAYQALGLSDWSYERVEVDEAHIGQFLGSLDSNWVGLSLTMPLKTSIQTLSTSVGFWARELKVANTAILDWNNNSSLPSISLYNTDVEGIRQALLRTTGQSDHTDGRDIFPDSEVVPPDEFTPNFWSHGNGTALILGNGNTALSALAACSTLPGISNVVIAARNHHGHNRLHEYAERHAQHLRCQFVPLTQCVAYMCSASLVISTLPAHAADSLAHELVSPRSAETDGNLLGTLLDVVYSPHPSELISAWRNNSGSAISGEEMLIYQAIPQVRLMTSQYEDCWEESMVMKNMSRIEGAMRNALQEVV